MSAIDTGLSREEARRRAAELMRVLRNDDRSTSEEPLIDSEIDVLHAACELLTDRLAGDRSALCDDGRGLYDLVCDAPPTGLEQAGALADRPAIESPDLLEDAGRLYRYAANVSWPQPDFDERNDLLADCALAGWRIARRAAAPPAVEEWQARFTASAKESRSRQDQIARAQVVVERLSDAGNGRSNSSQSLAEIQRGETDPHPLEIPIEARLDRADELFLDDPETLLPLLETLRQLWESDPELVLREATYIYSLVETLKPRYPIDAFLLDEREYFLGETARIAGNVCRALALRDEARRWFDLSEAWFLLTENAAGNLSKLSYHRLALRVEERDFEAVEKLLPQLIASFVGLGMQEDEMKARFLEGLLLWETDRLPRAIEVFDQLAEQAISYKNESLLAHARVNLAQLYAFLGDAEKSVEEIRKASLLLHKLGYRAALGKLQWGLGYLFRAKNNVSAAIEAYRAAQREFVGIGMRADVASVHLVIADLLIDAGQDRQAEWEIRQALPLIDEYKLVPEGFAALSLLRESLRRQKIDRSALRNLHGYFEEIES